MHFPADRDVGYFEQLLADRLTVKEMAGRKYRIWETPSGRANEAADCRVYAYAALCGLIHMGLQLNRWVVGLVHAQVAPEREPLQPIAEGKEQPFALASTPPKPHAASRKLISRIA